MNEKRIYIEKLATFLYDNEKRMSGKELAEHLNRNGFRTERGGSFKEKGRGIYRLLSTTYDWFVERGLHEEAGRVAIAFVTPDGNHPYK